MRDPSVITSLQIKLEYKVVGQSVWKTLPMTDRAYFDPSYMSEDEPADINDVALHDHAVDYLDVDGSQIVLTDPLKNEARTIIESFWNGGRNRIIERTDVRCGEVNYWEIITDCQVVGQPSTVEIMRIGKKEGVLVLYSHVFITDMADGSQTEVKIYP